MCVCVCVCIYMCIYMCVYIYVCVFSSDTATVRHSSDTMAVP